MSLKKSVLLALLVLLFSVPALWFSVIFPHNSAFEFFQRAPGLYDSVFYSSLPHDLEVQATNGIISINRPTPYCLIYDKKSLEGVLFDPNFDLNIYSSHILSAYPLCTPKVIVGESSVSYASNNLQAFKTYQIPPAVNLQLNRDNLLTLSEGYLPAILRWGWMLYLVAPILIIVLSLGFILSMTSWYALINKILFSILEYSDFSPFMNAYAVALRFFTALIAIQVFITLANHHFSSNISLSFPFLNTVVITTASFIWAKHISKNTLYSQRSAMDLIESQAVVSPTQIQEQAPIPAQPEVTDHIFDPTIITSPENTRPDNG